MHGPEAESRECETPGPKASLRAEAEESTNLLQFKA
jgi:hypothetical protein